MSNLTEVIVPDIGDFDSVEVIEILVKVGDQVKAEQSLITVESDKASMEIPSSHAGVVKSLTVKLGDKINKGSVILQLDATASTSAPAGSSAPGAASSSALTAEKAVPTSPAAAAPALATTAAPAAALTSAANASTAAATASVATSAAGTVPAASASDSSAVSGSRPAPTESLGLPVSTASLPHASPSVRKFARELGVDLAQVKGTGEKNRITADDVRQFVKQVMAGGVAASAGAVGATGGAGGLDLLPWPKVDFAKFGPIETKLLSRIKKISGANLHRNWVMIPHVTNNDEADITSLEEFRVSMNREHEKSGVKITMLAFLIKAVVAALKKFPDFNASIDNGNLVLKQYYNIGFAADTPNGLVVPVIIDADKKGIIDLAVETSALAKKARDGKLSPADMQGGCFSISSLGGIGGTHFTPIINAPELAILGVSRSYMKPVWDGSTFAPQLTLPLSLSYDHRVIDGAAAARFNAYLGSLLADYRRIVL